MRPAKAEVLLAVEIALEAVADGLVQQDARPARSQHDRHLAGRRLLGGERHETLVEGLAHRRLPAILADEVR